MQLSEILIAEDSPTQAKHLERILEEHGFRVQVARNGRDALEYLEELRYNKRAWEEHKPSMIISDIVMPEMSGCDLCLHLKKDEDFKKLPIILLTSLSDSREALKGLYSGADNLIAKPYDTAFLLARVDEIIATLQLAEGAPPEKPLPVSMDGQKYFVTSQRLIAINSVLTAYEMAVQKNLQLEEAQQTIKQLQMQLRMLKSQG